MTVPTNCEGLTLTEWLRAANAHGESVSRSQAVKAWRRGDDPTEYAYHLSQTGTIGLFHPLEDD